MTLTSFIEQRTGKKLPRFATDTGYPLSTLRGYALPINSLASRRPSRGVVYDLSVILRTSQQKIRMLTGRRI